MGAGWKHDSNVTKPLLGHFTSQGVSPKRFVSEFRVKDESGLLKVGQLVGPEWFLEGQFVDTRSNCRGMGFEGGMKRHGFKGQGASHGNSKSHRLMGSSGPSQGGGSRVHPGKRMPGNMGGQQVTVQNLKVLKVDAEKGILVLNGCIAGPKGAVVKIQDAIKKPWPVIPGGGLEEVKETLKHAHPGPPEARKPHRTLILLSHDLEMDIDPPMQLVHLAPDPRHLVRKVYLIA
ncbi:putative 54S ribosomal protein L9, mitochondrial [Glarea lozoyensis 74030]|uniref:Large ribosomal subunit protein uL3m n=1 Tax=Glarea lozoyensis (strain ATCC 74030 / MF5533) TaxID=1104152 RepID=H0ED68_GLAL7|nr:putative 54S ribosomal protein L9, mitochondrial [Glarea lozoyensis 74030]